jgi:RNase H-fold protein (predicted Holliday junction resolvase)
MILGLDPGTRKCGYALLEAIDRAPIVLGIAPLDALRAVLESLVAAHPVDLVALGRGTNSAHVATILSALSLPHVLVDERETTLRARWKRLVPRGMLLPDRPVDDYAALLIAERYLTDK